MRTLTVNAVEMFPRVYGSGDFAVKVWSHGEVSLYLYETEDERDAMVQIFADREDVSSAESVNVV